MTKLKPNENDRMYPDHCDDSIPDDIQVIQTPTKPQVEPCEEVFGRDDIKVLYGVTREVSEC